MIHNSKRMPVIYLLNHSSVTSTNISVFFSTWSYIRKGKKCCGCVQHACIGLVYKVKKTHFLCDCGGTIKNENGFYSFGVIYFMCFTISFAVIFFRLIPGECTDNIKRIKRHFVILCFAASKSDKNNNTTTNNEKEKLTMPCINMQMRFQRRDGAIDILVELYFWKNSSHFLAINRRIWNSSSPGWFEI